MVKIPPQISQFHSSQPHSRHTQSPKLFPLLESLMAFTWELAQKLVKITAQFVLGVGFLQMPFSVREIQTILNRLPTFNFLGCNSEFINDHFIIVGSKKSSSKTVARIC